MDRHPDSSCPGLKAEAVARAALSEQRIAVIRSKRAELHAHLREQAKILKRVCLSERGSKPLFGAGFRQIRNGFIVEGADAEMAWAPDINWATAVDVDRKLLLHARTPRNYYLPVTWFPELPGVRTSCRIWATDTTVSVEMELAVSANPATLQALRTTLAGTKPGVFSPWEYRANCYDPKWTPVTQQLIVQGAVHYPACVDDKNQLRKEFLDSMWGPGAPGELAKGLRSARKRQWPPRGEFAGG